MVSSFVFLDEVDVSHNVIYVDQPDLALPRDMYLDTESYADYITAYKTFMLDTATVMARFVKMIFKAALRFNRKPSRIYILPPKET